MRLVRGVRADAVKSEVAQGLRKNMTLEEMILWQELRGGRLDGLHFRRQQVIRGFVADFYCHAASLVVEVDGGVHASQREYDAERDKVLAAQSLRILRVPNEDVRNSLEGVLARIRPAAQDSRWFSLGGFPPHPSFEAPRQGRVGPSPDRG
ncbi:MAG: Very-short-patch-repair endonuclease [Dehalococcoidia bacterium]|nr:Very-short-patch-repair endonuclease [Dehalococcoidia bacterium]